MPQPSETYDLRSLALAESVAHLVVPQACNDAAVTESHSQLGKRSHATFELKFLITDECANEIMQWARLHLDPDPHHDPEIGDGYRVNSLYLDTPDLDVFHRAPGFRKRKYRLRRYGQESVIYFEQKQKRQGLVRKKRVAVPEVDIVSRLKSAADEGWDGHWFRRRVDEQLLRPVCQITYLRFARVTQTDEGPRRLTIDSKLMATASDQWQVPRNEVDGVLLLERQQILELKFRSAMPVIFRQLIERYQLVLTSFSKYRSGVEECVSLDSISGKEVREPADA